MSYGMCLPLVVVEVLTVLPQTTIVDVATAGIPGEWRQVWMVTCDVVQHRASHWLCSWKARIGFVSMAKIDQIAVEAKVNEVVSNVITYTRSRMDSLVQSMALLRQELSWPTSYATVYSRCEP
jgi:translation initiation factor IF-1